MRRRASSRSLARIRSSSACGGLDADANRDLIQRLNEDGHLDVRIYDTRSVEHRSRGAGARVRPGEEVKQAEESSELRASYSRLPGGQSLYRLPLPP